MARDLEEHLVFALLMEVAAGAKSMDATKVQRDAQFTARRMEEVAVVRILDAPKVLKERQITA